MEFDWYRGTLFALQIFAFTCGPYLIFEMVRDGHLTTPEAVARVIPLGVLVACSMMLPGRFGPLVTLAGVAYVAGVLARPWRESRRTDRELSEADAEKWRQAVAANDRDADAHLLLGHALLSLGNEAGAVAQYHRALALDPRTAEALDLHLVQQRRGRERRMRARLPDLGRVAAEARQRRVSPVTAGGTAQPAEPARRELLGAASEEARRAEMAASERLAYLHRLMDDDPHSVAARVRYAAELADQGYRDRAREELQVALKLEPGSEDAAALLRRLEGAGLTSPGCP